MTTSNLLMHCGAEAIDRTGLAEVETWQPLGRYHKPIPYISFVEELDRNLGAAGLTLADESFGVTKSGAQFFGLMEVKPIIESDRDFGLMLGLRASHDGSLSRGIVMGSRVFVCDNLCFSGEIKVQTRQTLNIEKRFPGLILEAVEKIPGVFEVQDERFKIYREKELKPRDGDAALIDLVRHDIITARQLPRAIQEWDKPSHEEHEGRSIWTLHNAVTEAIKPAVDEETGRPKRAAAPVAMGRTIDLTNHLDRIAGFDRKAH